MKTTTFFKKCQKYDVRLILGEIKCIRSFIVPINWTITEVEKYLRMTFTKKTIRYTAKKSDIVYLLQYNNSKIEFDDMYSVGKYWKDVLQRETIIQTGTEIIHEEYATDMKISDVELINRLRQEYPLSENIEITFESECLMKNDYYEWEDTIS